MSRLKRGNNAFGPDAGFGRREYEAESFRDAARGSEELAGGVLLAGWGCNLHRGLGISAEVLIQPYHPSEGAA
jgi:hypothetical protein